MGVVYVSSSAARSPVGINKNILTRRSAPKRPSAVAFKADKSYNSALVIPQEQILLPLEQPKEKREPKKKKSISPNKSKSVNSNVVMDYNEAAARLESIYKLSPTTTTTVVEDRDDAMRKVPRRRQSKDDTVKKEKEKRTGNVVIRNKVKKRKRLSLDKRIALKRNNQEKSVVASVQKQTVRRLHKDEKIERLVRDYSASTDIGSLDWKKMKIPPVLSSTEHVWLFKLMQPMKELLQVKDELQKSLVREPTDAEVAEGYGTSAAEAKKKIEIGRAARNKLIKHNLRLILFVMNKYFQDFTNGPKFQDLCQAGVKGLITAIDRFEPKRKFRLSTYGVFWIRHAIMRSMTTSSFTRVPFGLDSVRVEIQRVKLGLLFEMGRVPTDDEVIERLDISTERYREVMNAAKPVFSLNSRHAVTQEEFINGITDTDGVGADNRRQQPALLRLAIDDVLDSLKPKESLVIRQRYGLDGKGDRTLGEIAGNLNISREMVRKHEVKALMKLKHSARVDYLRRYII